MSEIAPDAASQTLVLPPPSLSRRASLEEALKTRRSSRAFLPERLSLETLSALLWSAFGINRPASVGRTAPSAHNWQEIEVFAILAEGAYRYVAKGHRLVLVKAGDLRASSGLQDFVADAPLNLVYVANFARMTDCAPDDRSFLAGADAGVIAQNVYLYCASAGLSTVVRGLIDRKRLAAALGLSSNERIVLAQTVGRPAAA